MNFKTNKITEYNSEIIENALRNSALKRHTSLDFKNSNIGITDDDKYFLGYENDEKIQFLRISSFFDKFLPNIIISFNKENFNEYKIRLKTGSMIVFIILSLVLLFNIIRSILNNRIESDLFSIFQVYALFYLLTFVEYKLTTKLIKKSIMNYIHTSKKNEIHIL